tara:strand:- start:2008 stop:2187 length:180 start_codon:yes stop_codon:yes gene_type:complete
LDEGKMTAITFERVREGSKFYCTAACTATQNPTDVVDKRGRDEKRAKREGMKEGEQLSR